MNLRNSPASHLVSRPVIHPGSLFSGASGVLGALVLWFLLTPLSAFALVLGDEHIRSTLDQPFLLEIELLDWEEVDLERLQVSLASREDFQAFDLEYQSYMDELSFEVTTNSAGNAAAVVVRGNTPMQEPYLDMLISARWPGGAVLREYIVLLDLPGTPVAPSPLLAAAGPAAPATQTQVAVQPAPAQPAPTPAAQTRTSVPNPETSGSRASYRVQPGDTLWSIASQVHPGESGTNLYQTLVSLHELNPDAFVNTNITLLRNNHLMRIPSAADVRSVDAGLAREIYESRSNQGQARVDALRRGEPLPEFTDFAVLLADGTGTVATASEVPEEAPAPRAEESAGRSDSSTLQLAYDETTADGNAADDSPSLPDSEQAAQGDSLSENPFEREVALLESLLAERESEIQVLEQEVAQLTGQLAEAEASVARMTTSLQATIRQSQEGQLQQAPDNRSTLVFGGLSGLLALLLLLAGAAIFRLKLRLEEQREELELLSEDGRGAAVLGFHPVLDADEDDDDFDQEFDREFDEDSDDRDERRYEEEVEGEEMAAEPDVDERYAYYSIDIKNEEDEEPDDEEEDDLDEAVYETDEEFLSAPSFFRAGDLNADDASAEEGDDEPLPYDEEDIREHYYDERDRISDTDDEDSDDQPDSDGEARSGEVEDRGREAGEDEDEVIEFRLSSETRQQAAQDATGETGFVERRRSYSDTEDDFSETNDPGALDEELREDMSDLDFSLDGLLVDVDDMEESDDEDSAQHPATDSDDIYSVDSEGNEDDSAELDEPDHDQGNGDTRKNSF